MAAVVDAFRRFMLCCAAGFAALSGVGFMLEFTGTSPGAINMGLGVGIVAVVVLLAAFAPMPGGDDKHRRRP